MADPYEILGVSRSSSEADIRRRYLELVRQYPPDRHPERFKEIHQAYESCAIRCCGWSRDCSIWNR